MAEISNIHRAIEQLCPATPGGSSFEGESRSRHQPFTSRRTLSLSFADALEAPSQPLMRLTRVLVSSMNLISQPDALETIGESISRPSSASRDDLDWNEYLRECKLFQPLAGVPPIATTPTAPQPRRASMAVLDAITEAL